MRLPPRAASAAVPVALLALLALLGAAGAHAAPLPARAEVARSADTGKVTFVGTAPGRPLERPAGFSAASSPGAVGRAFAERHADQLGLEGSSSVRVTGSERLGRGVTAVRLQQRVSGVDVLGGELVVHLDDENAVLSATGEAEPAGRVDASPRLASAAAERIAVASVAKHEGVAASTLRPRDTALRVFDARLLGGPGLERPAVVWAVRVTDGVAVRRLVLVDADRGMVVESLQEIHEADRRVCDAGNTIGTPLPCGSDAPTLARSSGGPDYTGSDPGDVNAAFDFATATDIFFQGLGRDSIDDAGMAIESTVNYCAPEEDCPYANAFWNGSGMYYGDGYAAADDVVAHELTHGVTEFSANLFYYYQSGAINESMSDVFGEIVDLETPDVPADDWLVGEDLPGGGAIRDMEQPGTFGDPASMVDANYWTDPADEGGVHANSGVGNRAAFLVAEAIGNDKTAELYYDVLTGYLTSASDYADLGNALGQACDNLVSAQPGTWDETDCTAVRDAVAATSMATERPEAPDERPCPAGPAAQLVFADDMEDLSGWRLDDDWYEGIFYATSGVQHLYGDNPGVVSDHAAEMGGPVRVPVGGFLRLRHAFQFETDATDGRFYDGGVVEVDDGSGFKDVVPASTYTGVVSDEFDNPLGGRRAFTGASSGYRTTVIPLGAYAGKDVRVRFRIGTDVEVGDYGWFIDDVAIGACGTPTFPSGFDDGDDGGVVDPDPQVPLPTITSGEPPSGGDPITVEPGPAVKAGRATVGRRAITFSLGIPAEGWVTVRGRAGRLKLRRTQRFLRGGQVRVRVPLGRAVRKRLRRGSVRMRFTIAFRLAPSSTPLTARKTVKLKRRR